MINWGTNLAGAGALFGAAFSIYNSVRTGEMPDSTQVGLLITGVMAGLGLLKAKDNNVTGGTVSAVTGASVDKPVSLVDEKLPGGLR